MKFKSIYNSDMSGGDVCKIIQSLVEQFKHSRLSMIFEDGRTESVWAVSCDQRSYDLINNNSSNELVYMILCNSPLSFGVWGLPVVAKTRGDRCPVCTLDLNLKHTSKKDWKLLRKLRSEAK